jgi:tetratricopeptide (TPR) repeat protein
MKMIRSSRSLLAAFALLSAPAAYSQVRGPPPTEALRLTYAGDDLKVEADQAFAKGEKKKAASKFHDAMDQYKLALGKNPDQVEAAQGFGESGINPLVADFQAVVDTLGPVVEKHPDSIELAYPYGAALFKLRRYADAEPWLQKVADAMKPEHLIVHYYLGNYYLFTKRGDSALAEFQRYLSLRPARLAGSDYEIQEAIGQAYLQMKKPAAARAAFEGAQAGHPELLPVQLGLASVLELEGRTKDAIAQLDHASQSFPSDQQAKARLGQLLLSTGDLARAEQVAQSLLSLGSTPQANLLYGEVKLAQKQPQVAESSIRKALEADPSSTDAEIALAKAVQAQGKNDEAIGLLEKALAGGANSVDLHAALGSTYRRAGRFQKAVEEHRKVVDLAPSVALGELLLGADHYATGEWDIAVSDYATALEREPKNANVKHWLALTLVHRAKERASSDLESAVRDLKRAFDLEHTATAGRSLGAALLTDQSFAEAKTVLTQVTQLADATWRDHLLLGYALLGNHEAALAKTSFEKAGTLTQDKESVGQAYAGWALANIELGDFDTAVAKLTEEGQSSAAARITQSNLPFALLRRSLARLHDGNVEGARVDVEAAEKLGGKNADLVRIRTLVRSLVDIEGGHFGEAESGLKHALTGTAKWASPNARGMLEAYLDYRRGQMQGARKGLAQAERKATPEQKAWATELSRAIDRRDGELNYAKGNLGGAEKAFKSAIAADPLNPFVINNLACVDYGKKRWSSAAEGWKKVEGAVAEADLNLGIAAQEHDHEYREAVGYYHRYLSQAKGARAQSVRGWKDRLMQIYGIAEPKADATVPAGTATNEKP